MEEQKKTEKKVPYEVLEKNYIILEKRLDAALQEIHDMNMESLVQRLAFLFKVLENYAHFDPEFVEKCSKEIQTILTIEDEGQTKTENK